MDSDGIQHTNDFATIPDQSLDAIANRVAPRQVASGVSRGIQQLGSDRVYSDGGNQQIIVEDSASPRVLMGNQKTFGEGLYVSKTGIDATTNTDPAQWIFNSNQNVFKIVQSGTVNVATPGISKSAVGVYRAGGTGIISHNLGFPPVVLAYVNYGSYYGGIPGLAQFSTSGSGAYFGRDDIYFGSDNTTTTFFVDSTLWIMVAGAFSFPAVTYPIKYYILQETAN